MRAAYLDFRQNLGSTGAESAASFATANGGFVTRVNPSPRTKGLESRSDPPEPPGEETVQMVKLRSAGSHEVLVSYPDGLSV